MQDSDTSNDAAIAAALQEELRKQQGVSDSICEQTGQATGKSCSNEANKVTHNFGPCRFIFVILKTFLCYTCVYMYNLNKMP